METPWLPGGRRKKKNHGLEHGDDGSINGEERDGVTVGFWATGDEGDWWPCHGRFGGEEEGGGKQQRGLGWGFEAFG